MDEFEEKEEQQEIILATVAGVSSTGLKIKIDGNNAAGQKEYKCNTSVKFSVGDRVKITENSGTYIVDFKVGSPMADYPFPAGGTTGQYLRKTSNTDYAVEWGNLPNDLPAGGTDGQILAKDGTTNYVVKWIDAPHELPTGGTTGQVLSKLSNTNYSVTWVDAAHGIPSGGSAGQVLTKNSATGFDVSWSDAPHELPTGGTTGQVLSKTSATNYAVQWSTVSVANLVNGRYELNLGATGAVTGASTTYNITLGSSSIPVNGCYINGELHLGTATTAKIGFFGHTVAARQTVANTATVATLITALKAYGLIA